jgi:hypothetical protein
MSFIKEGATEKAKFILMCKSSYNKNFCFDEQKGFLKTAERLKYK